MVGGLGWEGGGGGCRPLTENPHGIAQAKAKCVQTRSLPPSGSQFDLTKVIPDSLGRFYGTGH